MAVGRLALAAAGALGLLVGSFLNVVILRLPARESIVRPRSRCPRCRRPIPWNENVPILSFLLLRGRCRGCGEAISWRYPLVEALTGVLFAAAAWLLVVRWPGGALDPARYLHLAAGLAFLGGLVALTFIDLDHRILPDALTKPGMAVGAAFSIALPSLQDPRGLAGLPDPGGALLLSLAGMVAGYGSLWVVALLGEKAFGKEAMGLGDAKLLAMIGAFAGPAGAMLAAGMGLVLGLLMGGGRYVLTRDASFPFGPSLAAGGAAVFLLRREIEGGFSAALESGSDPRVGLGAALACGALLFWMRSRFPRGVFLALLLLVLGMAGFDLWLLFGAGGRNGG